MYPSVCKSWLVRFFCASLLYAHGVIIAVDMKKIEYYDNAIKNEALRLDDKVFVFNTSALIEDHLDVIHSAIRCFPINHFYEIIGLMDKTHFEVDDETINKVIEIVKPICMASDLTTICGNPRNTPCCRLMASFVLEQIVYIRPEWLTLYSHLVEIVNFLSIPRAVVLSPGQDGFLDEVFYILARMLTKSERLLSSSINSEIREQRKKIKSIVCNQVFCDSLPVNPLESSVCTIL